MDSAGLGKDPVGLVTGSYKHGNETLDSKRQGISEWLSASEKGPYTQ